ncbi:hypothetical protein GUJ93_ZPchr0009g1147 [Zizania palustris]|uniref:Uncharacterized protein n=1 Tax=Zizania palustris TaxID=103762 RepID=A0A8J5RPM3_ZIZPA|nr:hypothetical protein GUJ93_ZPchr0009g1147 [Zizania palustris]
MVINTGFLLGQVLHGIQYMDFFCFVFLYIRRDCFPEHHESRSELVKILGIPDAHDMLFGCEAEHACVF